MDIENLTLFRTIADKGSFAAAAAQADVDPSLVSRRIAALEDALGFRLFARSTRRISLTEAGQAYLDRIGPVLDEMEDAARFARDLIDEPKGKLRVAASTAFGHTVIVPMLERFLADNPEVDVDLVLDDRPTDLISEQIDLAIRLSPEAPADTIVRRLMPTRYRVVASPLWNGRQRIKTPEDLSGTRPVVFALPGFRDLWRFRDIRGRDVEVPLKARLEVSGALAVAEAARRGLGPALLADWSIREDLANGRLVDLFPVLEVAATGFETAAWILYPSRAYLPLKTRRFIDVLVDNVRENPRTSN